MPRVSESRKRKAIRQSRETAVYERKAVNAATRMGFRLMQRVLAAFRRGRTIEVPTIIAEEMARVEPILTETMTVGYLTGFDRVSQAGTIKAAVSPTRPIHGQAIRALAQRLQMTPEGLADIQKANNAQAVRVLSRVSDGVERGLERSFLQIAQEGLTTREGTKAIREAFAKQGIVAVNSFEHEAVFRTQTQLAYGAGAWEAAQDPVIDEILWGYQYVTVGDDRVRPEHAALEGTTAPKDSVIWKSTWPPNGWGCRCQVIYLFEKEDVSLPPTSAEIDGKVVTPGPDKGFDFNPGTALRPSTRSPRKPAAVGQKAKRVRVPKPKVRAKKKRPVAKKKPVPRQPKPGQKLTAKEQRVVDAFINRPRGMSDKKMREQLGMTQGEILEIANRARVKLGLDPGAKFV